MSTSFFNTLLQSPLISRVRRNHGLEHATINILSQQNPNRSLVGRSDAGGFWLLGKVTPEELTEAVLQGIERLGAGERHLALRRDCGTNLVVAGTAAGLAGALAMLGVGRKWQDKLERLPLAAFLATVALMLAQPLGATAQRTVTTSPNPGALELVEVIRINRGRTIAHRVVTRG
jgi:hypothetical protein